MGLKTTCGTEPKYYDHIAWFMGNMDLNFNDRAGVIDFADAVYPELTTRQMSYRVSDHFPLWVEFITDRSRISQHGLDKVRHHARPDAAGSRFPQQPGMGMRGASGRHSGVGTSPGLRRHLGDAHPLG